MKIILAEDNADIRRALAMQLEARGHVVLQATDGLDACEQFADDIDLIITDFQMPRMDGARLAKVAAAAGIRWVMMSGDPAAAAKALLEAEVPSSGRLLWKPFEFEALRSSALAQGVDLAARAPEKGA